MKRTIGIKPVIITALLLIGMTLMVNTLIIKAGGSSEAEDTTVQKSYLINSAPPPAEWNKTYGGTAAEEASSLVQTSDGGYAIAGYTNSYGAGLGDFWLIKTDEFGNDQWNKTYGGAATDRAYSMIQTIDGGYAIAGYTYSYGAGLGDFWLVKTDESGNMQWNKTYGGEEYLDKAYSVIQTSDEGYAIAGVTSSYGAGGGDFWLIKTDEFGNDQWNKTYGGAATDGASSLVQTSDGGYAIAGYTSSYGAGNSDFWLVKTDESGNMQWNKTYGGASDDGAWSLVQTSDGGYAIAGYTNSYGAGGGDFWLIKTDEFGNDQWNKTYGGTGLDDASSVIQTIDGGYAIVGVTYSYGAGNSDFWLVKTDKSGNMQWNKTYGGAKFEKALSLVQISDEGYAIAGYTNSYGARGNNFWLVKLAGGIWYGLTITTTGGNTNPPPGTYSYESGTLVSVMAISDATYMFDYWELDGNSVGANPISITMDADHNLHAVFLLMYSVTISAHCNAEGVDISVNITMDGSPTGYTTPHTFTNLIHSHTFTVPSEDAKSHPFKKWSNDVMSTTITVNSNGSYTAYYDSDVGGVIIPVDKFGLSAPYIIFASTTIIAVATTIYIKHIKRKKEKR